MQRVLMKRKCKSRGRGRGERGFTLIEVMVALGIFTIGFAGIIAMQTLVSKNVRYVNDLSLASNIAANTIENVRLSDYATLPPTTTTYYDFQGATGAGSGDPYFTVTTTVSEGPFSYKDIAVVVIWSYQGGGERTVRMNSRVIK